MLKEEINDIITVKSGLRNIICSDKYTDVMAELTDVGVRINKLIIRNYQFMRAYLLFCYDQHMALPTITLDFIKMSFQVLIKKKSSGPSIKGSNLILLNTLTTFYKQYKDQFNFGEEISGKYLSQIIGYESKTIHTAIINNIKQHFCDFLKHHVNLFFKGRINHFNEQKNKSNTKQINAWIKELKKDKQTIKDDLINGENKSDLKYRKLVDGYRKSFLPNDIEVSVIYDLDKNPQKYLCHMICLSKCAELKGEKQFQFFPLRTGKVIKYFKLDTKSLVEIFIRKDKNEYLKNISSNEREIWEGLFDLDNPIFKLNKYQFKYIIYTNCYTVSILFDNKINVPNIIKMKQKKVDASKKVRQELKLLSNEERDIRKKNKEKEPKYNLKKVKEQEEYKKLSKEEKSKITKEKRKITIEKKKNEKDNYEKLSIEDKKKGFGERNV